MVRFYVAAAFVRVGEAIAHAGIALAGGRGYVDIQFEVPEQPAYELIGWVLIALSLVITLATV